MNMNDNNNSIPRDQIFVLLDGVFVVKWSDNRVQELLTGQYRQFDNRDFGSHITDFELNQLKQAGIVETFDDSSVWLTEAPERSQFYRAGVREARVRSYYLNTTLDHDQISTIVSSLERLGLEEEFHARNRYDFVVIVGTQGRAFPSFDEAEEARCLLIDQAPEIFQDTVVAFIETSRRD